MEAKQGKTGRPFWFALCESMPLYKDTQNKTRQKKERENSRKRDMNSIRWLDALGPSPSILCVRFGLCAMIVCCTTSVKINVVLPNNAPLRMSKT